MSDLLSVDDLLSYMTYFNSLQCSNSPDYVEPTEEPCVCPPGAPGLPGIKVSLLKTKKYISFLYHLLPFIGSFFVILFVLIIDNINTVNITALSQKHYLKKLFFAQLSHHVECIPTMHLAIFKMAGICDLGVLLLICAK